MAKLINRITVIQRSGDVVGPVTVYREPRKRRKVSRLSRPLERIGRQLAKAQTVYGEEMLRRHDRSNRRRRDGWLLDAPRNVIESGRKAYNEARKGVPFRLLPKA